MEYLLLARSRSGVGVGVGVDIFRPESESELESLKIPRLRSPAAQYRVRQNGDSRTQLAVANDAAERGVKDCTDYAAVVRGGA